jgi:hypothetical protein
VNTIDAGDHSKKFSSWPQMWNTLPEMRANGGVSSETT